MRAIVIELDDDLEPNPCDPLDEILAAYARQFADQMEDGYPHRIRIADAYVL